MYIAHVQFCDLNSLQESFHSLDGTSESGSMMYFYSLRVIELPSSTRVTNSKKNKGFFCFCFFYTELCNSNLWHFCWQSKTLPFIVDLLLFPCNEYYLHYSFQTKSLVTLLHSSKKVQIMLWIIISLIGYCQWQ